ncbi:RHS repeat-associated core domain-containing protein [Bordetella bronchialis]|uniref:RHS repeat-associated core domain-containing protein n=1 Tax=Bordetella bronchialis TaxID=463025 RepID=UPI003CFEE7E0
MAHSSSLRYSGYRHDPLTGGYALGNGYRIYLPALMRFAEPDSDSPFQLGGINAYAYCHGDPVDRSDPSGHITEALEALAEEDRIWLSENWAEEASGHQRPAAAVSGDAETGNLQSLDFSAKDQPVKMRLKHLLLVERKEAHAYIPDEAGERMIALRPVVRRANNRPGPTDLALQPADAKPLGVMFATASSMGGTAPRIDAGPGARPTSRLAWGHIDTHSATPSYSLPHGGVFEAYPPTAATSIWQGGVKAFRQEPADMPQYADERPNPAGDQGSGYSQPTLV